MIAEYAWPELDVITPDSPPLADSELRGWLAVGRTEACCGRAVLRAMEAFGSVGGLFEAGERELAMLGFSRAAAARLRRVDWDAVRRDGDTLCRIGVGIVPIGTSRYPPRLAAIASPPPVLYCRGDPAILDSAQIAIVGSRTGTRGGLERARSLARELAACGLVITSGLARGIDAAAHRGALDAGGSSVAVLATGPDRIYPRTNRELAHELLEAGALVTERAAGNAAAARELSAAESADQRAWTRRSRCRGVDAQRLADHRPPRRERGARSLRGARVGGQRAVARMPRPDTRRSEAGGIGRGRARRARPSRWVVRAARPSEARGAA